MAEDAPCDAFITAEDVLLVDPCITGEECDPAYELIDAAIDEATLLIYMLSGRQIYGICSDTVRPNKLGGCPRVTTCYETCSVSYIRLTGTVISIDEVTIDGETIPASGYTVMDNNKLVRMRDAEGQKQKWPRCQNLDSPISEVGTFSITYTHGKEPDLITKRATTDMAIELIKLSRAETSRLRLPSNTTSVSRQGISLSMQDRNEMIRTVGSSIESVSQFMAIHNPANQRVPTFVWSPDSRQSLHRFS